jgi:hypothetical protein
MSLCLTNYKLRHEGVWENGCTDPLFIDSCICLYDIVLKYLVTGNFAVSLNIDLTLLQHICKRATWHSNGWARSKTSVTDHKRPFSRLITSADDVPLLNKQT